MSAMNARYLMRSFIQILLFKKLSAVLGENVCSSETEILNYSVQ